MKPLKLIDDHTPVGTEVIYVSTFGPPAARMFRGRTECPAPVPGHVKIRSGDEVMYVDVTHVYVLPPPSDAELLAALNSIIEPGSHPT